MSDRQLTTPAKINDQANQLFLNGERQLLFSTWETLDEQDRQLYPNIILNIAKFLLIEGDQWEAKKRLRIAKAIYEAQGDVDGIAQVYLQQAAFNHSQGNIEAAQKVLDHVKELAADPCYLAEAERLSGDLKMFTDPLAAIEHYKKAIDYLAQTELDELQVDAGLAQVYQQLASIYVSQGHFDLSGRSQRKAANLILGVNNDELRCSVLMSAGWCYAKLGHFEKAQDYFKQADAYVSAVNTTQRARLAAYKAWIAMLVGDDKGAWQELKPMSVPALEDTNASFQVLWARSYLYFFTYEYELAQADAETALILSTQFSTQYHQAKVLLAAIQIRQGNASDALLADLEAAVNHFTLKNQYIMISWSYLILGWAYKVAGRYSEVHAALVHCIRGAERMGHFKHLLRLYRFSFRDLYGYWEQSPRGLEFLKKNRTAALNFPASLQGKHIILLAFKQPAFIYALKGQVLKLRKGKNRAASLVFYMAQQRQATGDQIINALWTEQEQRESSLKSLRRLLNAEIRHTKTVIGFDWLDYDDSTGVFAISKNLLVYYDVQEFERIHRKTRFLKRNEDKLAEYQRGIALYTDGYLQDLDYPGFDTERQYYALMYEGMVQSAIELAEGLGDAELARSLRLKLPTEIDELD